MTIKELKKTIEGVVARRKNDGESEKQIFLSMLREAVGDRVFILKND